jgi:hypothetical protein
MKKSQSKKNKLFVLFLLSLCINTLLITILPAHHVLGRPSYSLNEDSNTPPSMQVETQIGDFYVTYMVYPAFPKPNESGRVNLYASRIDNGDTFNGEITFTVRDDLSFPYNLFNEAKEEVLGTQNVYDGVYRQGFLFKDSGSYIITAKFESNNEPYTIDFPLQIGESSSMMPIGITLITIVFTLLGVNIFQRRRIMQAKIRTAREESDS